MAYRKYPASTEPESRDTAKNNFSPLFHYLQSMFPNYDDSILHSVLQQEGNSIERAIEILLTFGGDSDRAASPIAEQESLWSDQELAMLTDSWDDLPSNVFTLPIIPSKDIDRYPYAAVSRPSRKMRRRNKKNQRKNKKIQWMPLHEFINKRNVPLKLCDEEEKQPEEPTEVRENQASEEKEKRVEKEALIQQQEADESPRHLEVNDGENCEQQPQQQLDMMFTSCSLGSSHEAFVFIEKPQEPLVVVKLYYSPSDIHRMGLVKSSLTFAQVYAHANAYLNARCQVDVRPSTFVLTYIDDEGDVIHLCSEEELKEAIKLHDECFWTDDKQPVLRLHIKPIERSGHPGHITITA